MLKYVCKLRKINMTETLASPQEAEYVEPDWDQVFERVEALRIPTDEHERAEDIARNFSTGKDIEMFGKAIHDVLVPEVESMPADRAIKAIDPKTGKIEREFLQPEERPVIFEQAADYIKQLYEMRGSNSDDEAFLARVASVVALTITSAHSYKNGNGRLARTMAELIRNGTTNKEDFVLVGTERNVSEKQQNGFRIYSYRQIGQSIDRGESDYDVIRIAASTNIPYDQNKAYFDQAQKTFSSPHGY
jgi:hypothetical protein